MYIRHIDSAKWHRHFIIATVPERCTLSFFKALQHLPGNQHWKSQLKPLVGNMSEKDTMPARLDEAALEKQAAIELHVDICPGTEVMRDVDDIHFSHGPKSREVYV